MRVDIEPADKKMMILTRLTDCGMGRTDGHHGTGDAAEDEGLS